MLDYMPIDWANKILVPTLIVDVYSEELFDRKKNGKAVYDIIKNNAETKNAEAKNAEAKYKVFYKTIPKISIPYLHFYLIS